MEITSSLCSDIGGLNVEGEADSYDFGVGMLQEIKDFILILLVIS